VGIEMSPQKSYALRSKFLPKGFENFDYKEFGNCRELKKPINPGISECVPDGPRKRFPS
jgi:hypothetical protein